MNDHAPSKLGSLLAETVSEDVDTSGIGGSNLRLRAGEKTIFPVESGVTGVIDLTKADMRLSRLQLRDQGGMAVMQATILVKGEVVGTVGQGDSIVPLRQYSDPNLAGWRQNIHIIAVEFMRPNEATVEALQVLVTTAGWQQYSPSPRAQRMPERERTSVTLFDKEAPGGNIQSRFASGMPLAGIVLLPDPRTDVLTTEYTDRKSGTTVSRPGFTNFVDAGVLAMHHLLQVTAAGEPAAVREATSNLNLLCGRNADTQYPLRPTLGYLSPVVPEGADPVEYDFFPVDAQGEQVQTPQASETPTKPEDESAPDEGDIIFGVEGS